jgi:serine/threonine protein kinase
MELRIKGGEMFDHLSYDGSYSEADAARLIFEIASELAFPHGVGVVHVDLKPENMLLRAQRTAVMAHPKIDRL